MPTQADRWWPTLDCVVEQARCAAGPARWAMRNSGLPWCRIIVEIAREAFDLANEVDAERRLRLFLRAVADRVIEGASDPDFSLRMHPIGTFKTDNRPVRNRVNPWPSMLFFTPEQTRSTFELSCRIIKAGQPMAKELKQLPWQEDSPQIAMQS